MTSNVSDQGAAKVGRLLRDSDLATRWGMDPENLEAVHDIVRDRQVPFLWMGPGEVNLSRISWRCVRFRERDVEAWESNQVQRTPNPQAQSVAIVGPIEEDLLGGKRPVRRRQG